jgi:hypothetical protein
MVRKIDIFANLESLQVFVDKAITSLNLFKKEIENKEVNFSFAYSYLCEAQGYLNILHKQMSYLGRNIEKSKRTDEEMADNTVSL